MNPLTNNDPLTTYSARVGSGRLVLILVNLNAIANESSHQWRRGALDWLSIVQRMHKLQLKGSSKRYCYYIAMVEQSVSEWMDGGTDRPS